MMNNISIYSIIATTVALGGCSSFTPPAQIKTLQEDGIQWVNYSSDRRGAIIYITSTKNSDGQITRTPRVCAEPSPDTSNNFESQAKASKKEIIDISANTGQNVVILPGRDKTVLTLRESLYRLCELSINRPDLATADIMNAYNKVITAVTQYAEAETARANADAETAKANAEVVRAETGRVSVAQANVNTAYQIAVDSERLGFQYVIDGKYKEAESEFSKAESIKPGIHNAYEIKNALRKFQEDGTVSEDERKLLIQNIVKNWSWGMPRDLLEKFKLILK